MRSNYNLQYPKSNGQNQLCSPYQGITVLSSKGMKLKQDHRGVKFKQRCWLTPWIDFNTEKETMQRVTLRRMCSN